MSTFNGIVPEFPEIRIDFFRNRATALACFLSHIHSDHLAGLESLRSPFVYCSAATREMLLRLERYPCRINYAKGILEARQQTYRHLARVLKPLPLETPTTIELRPGRSIRVTLFDANHCPGAVMFLIEGDGKTILYTGDLRCEPWFLNGLARNPLLIEYSCGLKALDTIYLDTSFIADVPFPSKAAGIVQLLRDVARYPDHTVFHIKAWTYGYEDVWIALSRALDSPIHVDDYKLRVYGALRVSSDQHLASCAAALMGHMCANTPHPGCLTSDPHVRLHSCDKGTMCAMATGPAVVSIQPIVARLANGEALAEQGVGGGGEDLEREAELNFSLEEDAAALMDLISRCESLDEAQRQGLKRTVVDIKEKGRGLSLNVAASSLGEGNGVRVETALSGLIPGSGRREPAASDKRTVGGLPSVIRFPYSRHSSYPELCQLIELFRPHDVWPCTVNIERWKTQDISIRSLFGKFCSDKQVFQHDLMMESMKSTSPSTQAADHGENCKRGREEMEDSLVSCHDSQETNASSSYEVSRNEAYQHMMANASDEDGIWRPISLLSTDGGHGVQHIFIFIFDVFVVVVVSSPSSPSPSSSASSSLCIMTALGYQVVHALTWAHVAGFCFLFILAAYVIDFLVLPRCPGQIPSFGYGHGFIAHLKNSFAHVTKHRVWMNDGYAEYGRKGLPFVVPAFLSEPAEVVLPRSMIGWLMEQPDTVVSAKMAHDNFLFSNYNFLNRRLIREEVTARIVTKFLPRHLATLVPAIDVEVQNASERALTRVNEHEWTSVNLWHLWLDIVPQVTNRMLVGEGMCRDEAFLASMVGFTNAVNRNCMIMRLFPRVLHPILGRLLAIPNWLYWRSAQKKLAPLIERRLADMEDDESSSSSPPPPEDFITWAIRLAKREDKPWLLDPSIISTCLLPVEFASIHTTVLTGHAWMLDMLSMPADEAAAAMELLTDEIKEHCPSPGVPWNKPGLQSLRRLDSSVRESQRLSNFSDTLVHRAVVSPQGLRHPDFDWTLPRGCILTVNTEGTHHDDLLFSDPLAYQPLRYARMREEGAEEEKAVVDEVNEKGGRAYTAQVNNPHTLGMVSTSDRHFAFGHGRHACPGRFFAAHELKLIMAHLLLNYDFRPIPQRPQSTWIGPTGIPPLGACIEVRRKKGSLSSLRKAEA
ncbi:hypothetical protein CP533_1558 [Ophiocordyceps camponoti-saundersi (nom. inval.)]|nr:hypothetical protein CP533_1558 [Ophiocordyceps camponoti-saundersi (nom. inval.)]